MGNGGVYHRYEIQSVASSTQDPDVLWEIEPFEGTVVVERPRRVHNHKYPSAHKFVLDKIYLRLHCILCNDQKKLTGEH